MAENCYELYRMRADPGLQQYRLRPYRYLREHDISIRVDLYERVHQGDIHQDENAKDLRKRLERALSDNPPGHGLNIGDVLVITNEGISAAYYVNPTKLILIPDFFIATTDGSLISIDSENCPLDGRKGSWMTVDSLMIDRRLYFLMQSQDYGRNAPYVIVDDQGMEYAADTNGFTDESIAQLRKVAEELADRRDAAEQEKPPAQKPKLEVWQQYLENGEYLRAAEITEEQNYNMIDGIVNNRSQKRSVLERLQEKRTEVSTVQMKVPELMQESEAAIDRSTK